MSEAENAPVSREEFDALRAGCAAALVSLSHTQGTLLRVISNLQDLQYNTPPDVSINDLVRQWESASRSLLEAATYIFGPDDVPAGIKDWAVNE